MKNKAQIIEVKLKRMYKVNSALIISQRFLRLRVDISVIESFLVSFEYAKASGVIFKCN